MPTQLSSALSPLATGWNATDEAPSFAASCWPTRSNASWMVHALVGFSDGALMAHVGPPDMRHAIGYALHWPERQHLPVERLDLAKISQLEFREVDLARYPAIGLAHDVMQRGGLSGAVFIAAKDAALDAFIDGRISIMQMAELVADVLNALLPDSGLIDATMSLDTLQQATQLGVEHAQAWIDRA